jgi:hypothetical protein
MKFIENTFESLKKIVYFSGGSAAQNKTEKSSKYFMPQ